MPVYPEVGVVLDATSAYAHKKHDSVLRADGKQIVDLTPAALGPFTAPPVNFDANLDLDNVNIVTCGGQATIPIVAAVSRVTKVHYAEIVAGLVALGWSGHARQRRRINPYHSQRHRGGRRRRQGARDHHRQSGRAADDHARRGVHADRLSRRGEDPPVGRGHGRLRPVLRAGLPP